MYEKFLEKFMPSKDMREYLKSKNLSVYDISRLIYGSPSPVEEKLSALIECYESYTDGSDKYTKKCIDRMISIIEKALQMKDEEGIFSLEMCTYDEFRYEMESSFESLFCRYDEAISFINDIYIDTVIGNLVWFEITKWGKAENGKLYEECTYYYSHKELRYINAFLSGDGFSENMIGGVDLNLPVPFKAGDIVEIDGCDFTPKFHALILDVGDNSDCCCLQGLARDTRFLWSSGAIKHGMIGAHYIMQPSMLYTIGKYNGRLREDEEILRTISNYINENSDKIRVFVDKVACGGPFKDKELLALMK